MFLVGAALFAVCSVAAGLATTPLWLIVGRLLQGAAGGLLAPQLVGLIQQIFASAERARAFGVYGAVTAAATALGPVLGGILIDVGGPDNGWRWAFFVNVPDRGRNADRGARAAALPRTLDHTTVPRCRRDHSARSGAVVAVLLPLVEAGRRSRAGTLVEPRDRRLRARAVRRVGAAGTGPVGASRCSGREVLASPGFRPGVVLGSAFLAGSTGIFLVLTVFAQQGLGYSALQAGLASVPYAVGSVAGALAGGAAGRA